LIFYQGVEYPGEIVNGVFITEKKIESSTLKEVRVHKNRQNIPLNEIKKMLGVKAKEAGGNTVTEFKYGQRQHKPWEHFFIKWDSISWYGEGKVVYIDYQESGD
jgi:hypothetical protein